MNSHTFSKDWLKFNGSKYKIMDGLGFNGTVNGYAHTHPGSTYMKVSNPDMIFMRQHPGMNFFTIANGGIIYRVWENGSYEPIKKL